VKSYLDGLKETLLLETQPQGNNGGKVVLAQNIGPDEQDDLDVQVSEPELARPKLFKVVMLNDDYTPMEFVVHVLEKFFSMGREKAMQIMLVVHTKGAAVCGIYPRDVAETKAETIIEYAKQNNHPLMCQVDIVE